MPSPELVHLLVVLRQLRLCYGQVLVAIPEALVLRHRPHHLPLEGRGLNGELR